MKRFFLFAISICLVVVAFAQSPKLTFAVRTVAFPGSYAPKHVMAIWVETSTGTFVKSLMVLAGTRASHLDKWKAVSGQNKVGAITGATQTSQNRDRTVTWDCKNLSGTVVPDGNYRIRIEGTSRNSYGIDYVYNFTVGSSQFSLAPANNSNLNNISLSFDPVSTPIESTAAEKAGMTIIVDLQQQLLRAQLPSVCNKSTFRLFDITGKEVCSWANVESVSSNMYELPLFIELPHSTYVLVANSHNKSISKRIVL